MNKQVSRRIYSIIADETVVVRPFRDMLTIKKFYYHKIQCSLRLTRTSKPTQQHLKCLIFLDTFAL